MSFLTALQTKRRLLRPTTTTFTLPDGRKFQESPQGGCVEVPGQQCGFVVDTKPDDVPAEVVEGVFLGAQDCCDCKILTDYRIGCVLSVGVEAPVQNDDVVYKFVQCLDIPETNLVEDVLRECVDFIEYATKERRSNVLVHCNAGVSRSASVVIGYLILVHHYSFVDAYDIVKNARNCIRPNDGFVKQLRSLGKNKGVT